MRFHHPAAAAILAALALVALPARGDAGGGYVTSHLSNDAELAALSPSVTFVAEGRIGDRGGAATFELDLGPDTAAPFVTAQYAWISGQVEPFLLTYDPLTGIVTFVLGGNTLSYLTGPDLNEVFVRTRAILAGSEARVADLVLDGIPVGDGSVAAGDGLDILRIQGANLIDGFVLTGTARLTWTGTAPTQSRLAFQIKVGTTPPLSAETTSWGRLKALFR